MLVTNIEKEKNKEEKRILVVDDEQDTLLLLQLILRQAGFKVYPFDNPLKALSSFERGLYDLAILDVKMPQMNGFQLREKIKEIDRTVKVCFITALANQEMYQCDEFTDKNEESAGQIESHQQQRQQYCELQKTMLLNKPFSNTDLVNEVNRIVNVN
jgi:CheY-like chemotaxis protein